MARVDDGANDDAGGQLDAQILVFRVHIKQAIPNVRLSRFSLSASPLWKPSWAVLVTALVSCAPAASINTGTPAPVSAAAVIADSTGFATKTAPVQTESTPAPGAEWPVNSKDSTVVSDTPRFFYVSSKGNDASSGQSRNEAWKTLARASRMNFIAGDRLLLEGGAVFRGTLTLSSDKSGDAGNYIFIGSYGSEPAVIDAGCGDGITVRNLGWVRIARLVVRGCGADSSSGVGVHFLNTLPSGTKLSNVRVDSVIISGFGRQGLLLQGTGRSGYRDVRITRVTSTDNGYSGIQVMSDHYPYETEYANEDVYIGYCDASDNPGLLTGGHGHIGSGIIISDVKRGAIERSRAYRNGWRSYSNGQPIGIWAWNASDITIQFNESVENKSAGGKAATGFDLDGGVTNSVLQYNYSRENEGAGYAVLGFPESPPVTRNVVRFNISVDDARRSGYAAIQVIGDAQDIDIFQNSVFLMERQDSIAARRLAQDSAKRVNKPSLDSSAVSARSVGAQPDSAGASRVRAKRTVGAAAAVAVLSSHAVPGDPSNEPRNIRVRENLLVSNRRVPFFKTDYTSSSVTDSLNRYIPAGERIR